MMVCERSGRILGIFIAGRIGKLGGTAEVIGFCPLRVRREVTKAFFVCAACVTKISVDKKWQGLQKKIGDL